VNSLKHRSNKMARRIYTKAVFQMTALGMHLIPEESESYLYSGPVALAAAPADYLDVADLKLVAAGGLIREDVVDKIFDISDIPTVFLDMIGSEGMEQAYTEWTEDQLAAPSITNAVVSGSDRASTDNDATNANAKRVGNHAQISTKEVFLTERQSQTTDLIGRNDEMGFQTARRLQELRRDVEATSLTGQASVQDDNNATAGKSAGAAAWLTTNKDLGAAGAVAGFQTGTKLVTAQTPGEGRGLTLTMIRTQVENVYNKGGNTTVLMSVPAVIKALNTYFTNPATNPIIARPTANVQGAGPGINQTAQMYFDAFKTDFGFFMTMVPNRLQQTYADAAGGVAQTVANVFGLDPRFWKLGLLYGWKVDPLAKIGLSNRKMLHVDWTLKCFLERANFLIADIILQLLL
jgi:hypothetical protein